MLIRNEFSRDLTWIRDVRLEKLTPDYSTSNGALFHTDAIKLLNSLPSDSVDLVMTSPPFALTRKKEYGNEPVDRYLDWFMPFCKQIHRILKPTGSFVLDIGGSWVPGSPVRSLYHFSLAVQIAEDLNFGLLRSSIGIILPACQLPLSGSQSVASRVKDAVNMVWWFGKTEWPESG